MMEPLVRKVLVVGGNGFIGSAVCKAALARGMEVISLSSSGRPYRTPKGNSPAWTSQVDWRTGDALRPETYAELLPEVGGVVHTIGTLLEDRMYKEKIRNGDVLGLLGSLIGGGVDNPLDAGQRKGSYELMNRDAALRVCEAFTSSRNDSSTVIRPFIYISAEDIFRPIIPAGYITSKREAEFGIEELVGRKHDSFRAVFVRPSLVYHAHLRPLTSPLAVLVDLSVSLHSKVPQHIPTPSGLLRALGSAVSHPLIHSSLNSMANALTIPPIHVEHVAQAICVALNSDVRGVIDVQRMRELIAWRENKTESTQHA